MKNENTRAGEVSRRDLSLGLLGAGVAAAGASYALGSRAAAAPARPSAPQGGLAPAFLLNIFCRGGFDGLTFLCPHSDPDYPGLRNLTRIYPPGFFGPGHAEEYKEALPLTSAGPAGDPPAFGLPKAMAPLQTLFQASPSRLCFFHAMGGADPVQSHFAQMNFVETATTSSANAPLSSGWIARHLQTKTDHLPPEGVGFRAIGFSSSLARSLQEGPGATPVPDPVTYDFPISFTEGLPIDVAEGLKDDREAAMSAMYTGFGAPLDKSMDAVLEATGLVSGVDFGVAPTGGTYPTTPFGTDIKQTAQLAKQIPTLEVVDISIGGWDTHVDQGVHPPAGRMHDLMDELSKTIEAFYEDMTTETANPRPFIVFVHTEFGRTAPENGNGGTDHGRAGSGFVLGSEVSGGQVLMRQRPDGSYWPGLGPTQLDGIDVKVTTDIRDVMGEIVEKALKNPTNVNTVIPPETATGYQYTPLGFLP